MSRRGWGILSALALIVTVMIPPAAQAAPGDRAVINTSDCTENTLTANDDSSTSQVHLPFGVNFYGTSYESLWVNNNGNVTFDQPLSTYTPFGIAGTSAQIIAPFFADVDTRGTGSQPVTYGWGETTYEGHRAFCVSWVNVGYYAGHADKLNSFQLLLVNREDSSSPGDFDIVFNYDKVQWETGDASGGVSGLGGISAAAGFSNGTGREGTSYELSGSLTNGAFLDSSPTGLAVTSTDSTVPGRHVFRVRGGSAPLTRYVALGDSFQSGEGAGDYLPLTDTGENRCHRSSHAYAKQLVDSGRIKLDLDFGACSGALVDDLPVSYSPDRPPYTDGIAQLDRLDSSTKLVTLGIGGNDLGFGDILNDCIMATLGSAFNPFSANSCQKDFDARLQQDYDRLVDGDRLSNIYKEVRSKAPFARIVVVGYPRFYVEGGASNFLSDEYCAGVRIADQRWINSQIRRLNSLISDEARSVGLQYVDTYSAPDGHELCGPSGEHFLNGINVVSKAESYHPTAFGQSLIADRVSSGLDSSEPGTYYNVLPGQTITTTFQSTGTGAGVSIQWPGSDVVLTLTSPSGKVYDRSVDEAGVQHQVGPTFESYQFDAAEPGQWTVTMFGAVVAPQGEQTRLDVWQSPAENHSPVAHFTQTVSGRTVTVDAGASTDADGNVIDYLWEFGDGTTATGPKVTHTYTQPGTYLTTLAIRDDQGGEAFTSADHTIDIPKYAFEGFLKPVAPQPEVTSTKAGSAVPMKFSLGADYGLNILVPGSPTSAPADCSTGTANGTAEPASDPGESKLTYDPTSGTYNYVWKTEKAWAGTCRTFTLGLDDGSTHQATFRFTR